MKGQSLILHLAVFAALGSATAGFAQNLSSAGAGPVPAAITTAKRVFVSNAGADSGLFPNPFSGDTDRGYDQFYASLKSANQFELVADPSEADLVLELELSAPTGPTNANKQLGAANPVPMFRLVIYDRKTHYVLWTLTQSIEVAVLQKTHDRNFDDALKNLFFRFQQLAGKLPTPAP